MICNRGNCFMGEGNSWVEGFYLVKMMRYEMVECLSNEMLTP